MAIKTLIKKEILEVVKTSKIYVLPLIFLFIGFSSPITTKMMPDIVKSMAGKIQISMPEPFWFDSFLQFHKNLNQMALIAVILVFMGLVADEKNKGTAILVLTKPVSRAEFIMAKFIVAWLLILMSTIFSFASCAIYTQVLFGKIELGITFTALVLFMIYSTNLLAVIVGLSSMLRSSIAVGGLAFTYYILNSIIPMLNNSITKFLPGRLTFLQNDLILAKAEFSSAFGAIIFSSLIAILMIYLGIKKFQNEELVL